MLAKARPQPSLKGRALRYLSQREHSRAELQRKLARHAEDAGEIAGVLDELEARGFIDHQRVAESVAHRRGARFGASRVKQELQALGLEPRHVAEALAGLRATELDRAREVWRRKFGALPQSPDERAKQSRFLAARGFGGDVIRRVLADDGDALG